MTKTKTDDDEIERSMPFLFAEGKKGVFPLTRPILIFVCADYIDFIIIPTEQFCERGPGLIGALLNTTRFSCTDRRGL